MSIEDKDNNDLSICANCGKEGDDINNTCNKCKMVKYCNAACKKKHRHKHKKDCEEYQRLAAEHAAELHDKELFKQPPPEHGDCQICFIQLPSLNTGHKYQTCCGKTICSGCVHAPLYDDLGNEVDNEKCPFCRTPHPTSKEEAIKRLKKRAEAGDAKAIYGLGGCYRDGMYGLPQDYTKALEYWHLAAELGYAAAYRSIGVIYDKGRDVDIDKKKAMHYYELAAMKGDVCARYNLGIREEFDNYNMDRALKHYMIAVKGGNAESLDIIQNMYSNGLITKDDYTTALRSYQEYLGEVKSVQRDKAAAANEEYRYY